MTPVVVGLITRQRSTSETEYLLVRSKDDFGEFTGCFYPPSGHLEINESEQEALVREMKEEVGLEVLPVKKVLETKGDIKGEILCWWSCQIIGGEFKINEDELAAAGFFTRAEMEKLQLWPATKKFFELAHP